MSTNDTPRTGRYADFVGRSIGLVLITCALACVAAAALAMTARFIGWLFGI